MAVINELPQVRVSIRIAGSEGDCVEYDDPDPPGTPASSGDATHSTSKVIESQDNTEYYLNYEVSNSLGWFKRGKGLTMKIWIDGKDVASRVLRKNQLDGQVLRGRLEAVEESSNKRGKAIMRKFKFSAITQVNGRLDHFDQDREAAKHLGEIEVAFYRVTHEATSGKNKRSVASLTEFGETALKGKNVSHGTEFSGAQEKKASKRCRTKPIDGDGPLARMTFRYINKSALQIGGIIPRDPPPPRVRPTVEGMDLSEIMRLAQERLDEINDVEDVKRVKRQASSEVDSRPRKVFKTEDDGTVDLTDD
ncbi:hypothetical protein CMUS01_00867 [Colletotrichum musicola]|uniref:DUF7918 domain-containing protein n=1 Tax=Colletotrichum musicola TaxID=2175873 RepID=A0A8H6NYC0_9PEZI|nr:hypothetical protein CMUS01_00867 [Colletotrichum musicola]